jgi:alanine dehydrogenase
VDIAIDQGGCAETSRPTTHEAPTYVEEGVTHYCVANMPAAYARTATQALTNVTYPYIEVLAENGLEGACQRMPGLKGGINVMDGRILQPAVAAAQGAGEAA